MAHEEFEDALPLYAIGALGRQERQSIDAHLLGGCTACHTALREYQATAAQLPHALPLTAPPAGLKDRIMAVGNVPAAMSPEEFGTKAREDSKRFGAIIRERGITGGN